MIDLHCHLLPGIDDGPASMPEAVVMARAFVDSGTTRVAVTPHVNWQYADVDGERIAAGARELRTALADAGVELEVLTGAEISLSRAGDLPADELRRLTLGAGPWLLVEPPFTPNLTGVERVLDALLLDGHRLVLAHPERCPALACDLGLLRRYAETGVLCQVTSGSLTGDFGRSVQRASREMVDTGLAHLLASDAHDAVRRPPGLTHAAESLRDPALAAWLTHGVPEAIACGTEIPPRPEPAGGRRRRGPLARWSTRRT